MIEKDLNSSTFFDKAVLLSVSSLLVMGFFVFMCMGKKKKLKDELGQPDEIVIGERNKQEITSPVVAETEDVVNSSRETTKPKNVELVPKYETTNSGSQNSIDPYATVDKSSIKNDTKLNAMVTENSVSGSGNSDSGNGLYAKVKNVEKKEEIAYAVVDIKESQDKYDMVNGGLVRRLTEPDIALAPEIKPAEDKEPPSGVEQTNIKNEESSGGSGLYAAVNSTDEIQTNEAPSSPKQEGILETYAVIIKSESEVISTIKPEESEDSGTSGFYAKVDNNSVSPQNDPPPLPPPHLHQPVGRAVGSDIDPDNGTYEPITNDLDRCNTYDSISEYKTNSKGKKDKKENQGDGGKKNKHNSKHKHKSQKKQDITGDVGNAATKSPKNRFSRVNPFKLSKKHKHKNSTENINNTEQTSNELESTDPVDILLHKEKGASLPTSARKSPSDLNQSDVIKRHSSPHVPPPLPSVEQLIHLTQHQNPKRGSSFDASSPEISPESSPRTPIEVTLPPPHEYKPRTMSTNNTSGNNTSRESRSVLSETSDNCPSSSTNASVEPRYDGDDKYAVVDNALKVGFLRKEGNEVEEDDKYEKVNSNLKLNIKNKDADIIKEDDKYTKVDNHLKLSILNHDVLEKDDKYATVKNDTKQTILDDQDSVVQEDDKYTLIKEKLDLRDVKVTLKDDFNLETVNDKSHPVEGPLASEIDLPDYAVVDLVQKHKERERIRALSKKEELMSREEIKVVKPFVFESDNYESIASTASVTSTVISATTSINTTKQFSRSEPLQDSDYEEIERLPTLSTATTIHPIKQDKRFSSDSADYMYVE